MSPSNPSSRRVTAAVPPASEAPTIAIGGRSISPPVYRPTPAREPTGERRKSSLSRRRRRRSREQACGARHGATGGARHGARPAGRGGAAVHAEGAERVHVVDL